MKRTFFLSFLLIIFGTALAVAQPMPPHQYYGDVTINGEPAIDGLLLTVLFEGDEIASTITNNGKYGYDPVFYAYDEDAEGHEIFFFVQGVDTGVSTIYSNQKTTVTEIDIDFSGEYFCGDNICGNDENCSTCPDDCGLCNETGNDGDDEDDGNTNKKKKTNDDDDTGSGGGTRSSGSGGYVSSSSDGDSTSGSEIVIASGDNSGSTCTPSWDCSDWQACISGIQKRTCVDLNRCGTLSGKPEEERDCLDWKSSQDEFSDATRIVTPPNGSANKITGAVIGSRDAISSMLLGVVIIAGLAILVIVVLYMGKKK